jgi:hypothetical protein
LELVRLRHPKTDKEARAEALMVQSRRKRRREIGNDRPDAWFMMVVTRLIVPIA